MRISLVLKRRTHVFLILCFILCLVVYGVSQSSAATPDLVFDQQFPEGDQYFDGNRVEVIDAPPEMDEWTIVARVRPTLTMEKIPLETVTSIDFCDGKEIITNLGKNTFVYRNIGETAWKESRITVLQPHSITWSDSLQRYFVADTDNHRIISFDHLNKPFCDEANNPDCITCTGCEDCICTGCTDCICTGCTDCQPYRETHYVSPDEIPDPDPVSGGSDGYLCRPHDLEYNPVDKYFYGVTAPYFASDNCTGDQPFCECRCATDDPGCSRGNSDGERRHTYLFRFKDIDAYGTVENGEFIDLKKLGIENGRYTRAVTIGDDGRVYVIDSSRPNSTPQVGVYEIINFVASPEEPKEGEDYKYYEFGFPTVPLNDIEYFNGRWYGTSNKNEKADRLFYWYTWDDFLNLVSINLPDEFGDWGYFLTKWEDSLYVAYYGTNDGILRIGDEVNDVEIYVNEDNVEKTILPIGTIFTNDRSGWHNDVLFGINPDPWGFPAFSGMWEVVHHDYAQEVRTHAPTYVECAIEPHDQWYHLVAS